MNPTPDYQSTIPFTLLNPSPGLAALHAARLRILYPSIQNPLQSTHCSKCGSFLLTGHSQIRVQRLNRTTSRVLQRTCPTCRSHDNLPLERGNAALYPKRKRVSPLSHAIAKPFVEIHHSLPQRSPSIALSDPSSLVNSPSTPTRSKARPKQKSGLQDMLLRNRKKEEKEKREKQSSSGGLAAYLAGL